MACASLQGSGLIIWRISFGDFVCSSPVLAEVCSFLTRRYYIIKSKGGGSVETDSSLKNYCFLKEKKITLKWYGNNYVR